MNPNDEVSLTDVSQRWTALQAVDKNNSYSLKPGFPDGGGGGSRSSLPLLYALNNGYTDKKENRIFLLYKEILNGAVAKSYMTYGLLIYGEIFAHFLVY
jgi:hypothetical protein